MVEAIVVQDLYGNTKINFFNIFLITFQNMMIFIYMEDKITIEDFIEAFEDFLDDIDKISYDTDNS